MRPAKVQQLQEMRVSRNAEIAKLETWLSLNPGDLSAMRRLVTTLEHASGIGKGSGSFSKAQAAIGKSLEQRWQRALFDPRITAESYANWLRILDKFHISRCVPIGQVFSGRVMKVKGVHANCNHRLKFFAETKVISSLCHDCYKVQILPANLEALFQTYFLLLGLKLPNDNARKCMIELRDGIKYPYKAYIYCDSIPEVQACLEAFLEAQQEFGADNISSAISHGCSEYGLEYPEFKYSDAPRASEFTPPASWEAIEEDYFSKNKLPQPARRTNTKSHVSLRDVFAFRTWVQYAELIGDEASQKFNLTTAPKLPAPFIKRVTVQAERRNQEMSELASRR